MAMLTNSSNTFAAIGNREDLTDYIYNIDPVETPFTASIDKNKAMAVLHEWQTQTLAAAGANAQLEGDDTTASYTFAATTLTTRLVNRCQISRRDVVVNGTQDAVKKAGRKSEIAYQLKLKADELKRDREFVLTNNQAPVTGNTTTARQLRPLPSWYATNDSRGASGADGTASTAATDGTQRPLTESLIKGVLQSCWTNGGDVNLLMPGPFNKTVISGFTGNNTRMQDTRSGKLMTNIEIYQSDFGTHSVKANRFSRDRDLHCLDTSLWALSELRPMQTIDIAKTGDNEKAMILTEYTLESRNERGSGVVADLTTS